MSNLGLKTNLDRYGVPREDLPTIAERALGGRNEIHGDGNSPPRGIVLLSMKLESRQLETCTSSKRRSTNQLGIIQSWPIAGDHESDSEYN